jgi:hypothetical protein
MSVAQDIKEAFNSVVQTALSDFKQLPDTLATEMNTNLHISKGFSVLYGECNNLTNNFCPGQEIILNRQYDIRLTYEYVPNYDESYREDLESELINSSILVVKAVYADTTLAGVCIHAQFIRDTGIQYLVNESEEQALTMALTFEVGYSETSI